MAVAFMVRIGARPPGGRAGLSRRGGATRPPNPQPRAHPPRIRSQSLPVSRRSRSPRLPLLRLPVGDLDNLEKLVAELTRAWHRRWKTLEMGRS